MYPIHGTTLNTQTLVHTVHMLRHVHIPACKYNSHFHIFTHRHVHIRIQAEVIVWDLDIAFKGDTDGTDGEVGARARVHKLVMHRVKVRYGCSLKCLLLYVSDKYIFFLLYMYTHIILYIYIYVRSVAYIITNGLT